MIKIFILALRNVFRNKRRTLLTFFAIISGVVALIVFGGFVEFSFWGLRESTIRSQLGHIQIYKKGYNQNYLSEPYKYLLSEYQKVKNLLNKLPYIEVVTAGLSNSGLISSGERTLNCIIKGVEPESETKLTSFESLIEGENLNNYCDQPCVIIGSELYKGLGVRVGENITLVMTTVDGGLNAIDVKIVGVCQSGSKEYDSVIVKIPLKILQRLMNTESVEKIIVLLNETENTDRVVDLINKSSKDNNLNIETKKWNELATYYNAVVRLYNGIFSVIKFIIASIVFFSIANTITMSIFERYREIGTLRAIGTKRSLVVLLLLLEGLLIGVIGGIIGCVFGIFIAKIINISGGICIPPPPGMSSGYTALILVVPKILLYSYISTIIISVVSSFYPAFRASKLKIVEALRYI
ncbi:MAG: ABC transporter permease [Endomicrobia bacterium]|nr:ABC transporter permease [Endomicrobiia bacterium]